MLLFGGMYDVRVNDAQQAKRLRIISNIAKLKIELLLQQFN